MVYSLIYLVPSPWPESDAKTGIKNNQLVWTFIFWHSLMRSHICRTWSYILEGLMPETSALQNIYGDQFLLSIHLVILPYQHSITVSLETYPIYFQSITESYFVSIDKPYIKFNPFIMVKWKSKINTALSIIQLPCRFWE